jgi:hypothetical protein
MKKEMIRSEKEERMTSMTSNARQMFPLDLLPSVGGSTSR